ncbi:urocortin-2 [Dipodomys merriami]|uniref:urocortin-2 n=1 Tax=Dipodomys merriami TaxID=94247 RepID=UPI0038503C05
MTRCVSLVLMVVLLDRVLAALASPVPAFQPSSEDHPQTTPSPITSKSPSVVTLSSSVSWSHPGPRMILSLDVPLGLLQIVLEQARSRAARERATANAHVLASVGRR